MTQKTKNKKQTKSPPKMLKYMDAKTFFGVSQLNLRKIHVKKCMKKYRYHITLSCKKKQKSFLT